MNFTRSLKRASVSAWLPLACARKRAPHTIIPGLPCATTGSMPLIAASTRAAGNVPCRFASTCQVGWTRRERRRRRALAVPPFAVADRARVFECVLSPLHRRRCDRFLSGLGVGRDGRRQEKHRSSADDQGDAWNSVSKSHDVCPLFVTGGHRRITRDVPSPAPNTRNGASLRPVRKRTAGDPCDRARFYEAP